MIDVNCDMGEGVETDHLIMPYISSANIACGYHAGDSETMKRTAELAVANNVFIGAHPGFNDKANFGRTEMQLPLNEIYALVTEQVFILQKIAGAMGTALTHVKPHGALYNMSAKNKELAAVIAKAVFDVDPKLVLFGLSGSHSITEAKNIGLQTMSEVFADRSYQDDGSLTPRSQPGALIETTEGSIPQVLQMIQQQTVTSISGRTVPIIAETICVHGDGEHAVAFAETIYHTLQNNAIGIRKK
jgi:UPF0271 protein